MKTTPPPPGFVYAEDIRDESGELILGIASRLGITPGTYRKWRMAGKGPESFKLGRRVVARIDAVDAYIAEQERAAREPSDEARPPEPRKLTPRKPAAKKPTPCDVELAATA
ncbi:helix-turn-helix transcriptional regulator [Streptomyces smyrnaeus]|uniref:helix-turn-helix transcriptional regulator n=1 Tax=Streptomyces smyrnaeus TaxID=1387713 RepID=UPI0033E02E6A